MSRITKTHTIVKEEFGKDTARVFARINLETYREHSKVFISVGLSREIFDEAIKDLIAFGYVDLKEVKGHNNKGISKFYKRHDTEGYLYGT